ncbi:DUF3696 domain-containing protein [Neptunomonas antarctica]|uniref:Predicted ATPase n=1 Tax=Neptunomonas antarctica TaxID=619304 RepID=A0A1N7P9G0_9GAMM|nr:DUF3696 domain-containing protein [Neptunomonas antarctica]SIT07233.1 Predicted ATPase [Neptunomonas antarctica]
MIKEIKLKNFKCFKEKSIALKPLTFLSGINGMGKSTIIQSLLLLRQSYGKNNFDLNGDLFEFGYYEDLHSEFADDEDFYVKLIDDNEQQFSWSALVKKNNEGDLFSEVIEWDDSTSISSGIFGVNFQFLSAERWGPRVLMPLNKDDVSSTFLGKYGQFLVSVLDKFELKKLPNDLLAVHPSTESRNVHEQISAWLNEISPGSDFDFKSIKEADSGLYTFTYKSSLGKTRSFRPANVGFGLSYTLPILTALLTASKGSLVIIENPEAHLHPKAQVVIGKLLAICAQAGVQLVIESHSDHVLNGIRIAVKEGCISRDNVVLNFVNRKDYNDIKSTDIITPEILENGKLSFWPEGFFDEWDNALDTLI